MQKNLIDKIKSFLKGLGEKIKKLKIGTKVAIGIGIVTVILALVFTINYSRQNKYKVLFSGLDSTDSANITKALEDKKVDTKIDGDSILVPKDQVDKLRIELSSNITNGSKGFELMDESSNLFMTDEEFQIEKTRMIQGELEKTIKTFPGIDNARVHITQGEQSVFNGESKDGKAAVYISLKDGRTLDKNQIKSIISLISASGINIPKKNVEVIDQNMVLLSEGIYDGNGNLANEAGLTRTKNAEKQLSEELKKRVKSMLEPIFGVGKVEIGINATLNSKTVEKNELKLDPKKVISSSTKSENSVTDEDVKGSPVDNNMNNTANAKSNNDNSKEESIKYKIGESETKTLAPPGDVKRITASIAIDGNISDDVMTNVEDIVQTAIGMDTKRGDSISVIGMNFNKGKANELNPENSTKTGMTPIKIGIATLVVLAILLAIGFIIFKKKGKQTDLEDTEEMSKETEYFANLLKAKQKETELDNDEDTESNIEEEVKSLAENNPDEISELIKRWLNE